MTVFKGGMEKKHMVAVMNKGEIVGERALFLQRDRAATVSDVQSVLNDVKLCFGLPCAYAACDTTHCLRE